jgi:hypothetical protein
MRYLKTRNSKVFLKDCGEFWLHIEKYSFRNAINYIRKDCIYDAIYVKKEFIKCTEKEFSIAFNEVLNKIKDNYEIRYRCNRKSK